MEEPPSAEAPSADVSSGEAPSAEAPSAEAPSAEAPDAEAPMPTGTPKATERASRASMAANRVPSFKGHGSTGSASMLSGLGTAHGAEPTSVLANFNLSCWEISRWRDTKSIEELDEVDLAKTDVSSIKYLHELATFVPDIPDAIPSSVPIRLATDVGAKIQGKHVRHVTTLKDLLKRAGCAIGEDPDAGSVAAGETREEHEEDGFLVSKVTGMFYSNHLHLIYIMPFYDKRLPEPKGCDDAHEAVPSPHVAKATPAPAAPAASEELSPSKLKPPGAPGAEVVEEEEAKEVHDEGHDSDMETDLDPLTCNFAVRMMEIKTEDEWQHLMADQPWSEHTLRIRTMDQLSAKMDMSEEMEIMEEGVHGVWEISSQRENRRDIMKKMCLRVSTLIDHPEPDLCTKACAAAWMMAAAQAQRRKLAKVKAPQKAIALLKRTRNATLGNANDVKDPKKPTLTREDRELMQVRALGLLQMFALDKQCRPALLAADPKLEELLYLCKNLPEYSEEWGPKRRKWASRCISIMLLRDGKMRESFVKQNIVKTLLELLKEEGPGSVEVWRGGGGGGGA
uniref:Uncharacterized protein n=1 Tax=Pyramimonas obovata TaxID=1411642 RepID=A0A7S0WJ38_9CHLO|mmetsp:Transcript_27296/g.59616  ORF Transcript_27296/g.59616 Transcript_27296/m.59616 type:complete len:566 (+) Transcript_27296:73-1770(+)